MKRRLAFAVLLSCAVWVPAWAGTAPGNVQTEALELQPHDELLPEVFDLASLTGPLPTPVEVRRAGLFRVPAYGPGIYLLVLALSTDDVGTAFPVGNVAYQLRLFPGQQRTWVLLVHLPEQRWPSGGRPDVVAALPTTLSGCDGIPDEVQRRWFDEAGEEAATRLLQVPWRQAGEPVLELRFSGSDGGSGGGRDAAYSWYLSVARDAGRPELQTLACAPADAGYWSKPSYDMQGSPQGDGEDERIAWSLEPRAEPEGAGRALYLLERQPSGDACLRARYLDSGEGVRYRLDPDWSAANAKTKQSSGSTRPPPCGNPAR